VDILEIDETLEKMQIESSTGSRMLVTTSGSWSVWRNWERLVQGTRT